MVKSYEIEVTKWGLILTFRGRICKYDLENWFTSISDTIKKLPKKFHLMINLINSEPPCSDSAKTLTMIRAFLYGRGMEKIVIVYDTSVKLLEITKAFNEAGLYHDERYISTNTHAEYMEPALNWLMKGIEP